MSPFQGESYGNQFFPRALPWALLSQPFRLTPGRPVGLTLVLRTWGQNLEHHPHVHGIAPAGGLALDGSRRNHCRERFLLPVQVLR